MMISPEIFYRNELQNQPPEKIEKTIRNLKREINRLKREIENPHHVVDIDPDEKVQLAFYRLYLEHAFAAYKEAGGTYQPNQIERRVAAFDAAIPTITKIVFSVDSILRGYKTYTVTFAKSRVNLKLNFDFSSSVDLELNTKHSLTKEQFLKELQNIHLGEWHKHYFRDFIDGTQWDLTIEYEDGRTVKYDGSDTYPFSFDEFYKLLGCEDFDKLFYNKKDTKRSRATNKSAKSR